MPQVPAPYTPARPRPGLALASPAAGRLMPLQERVIGSPASEAFTLGRYVRPKIGISERVRYDGDQHILVVGANGKGKFTRFLAPNLLQMNGNRSLVVIDPKGELAAVTAPFRRALGPVIIINPFNLHVGIPGYEDLRGVGFNPFAHLDPASSSFNRDAGELADAMIAIEGKEPFFPRAARSLVSMAIMHATVKARRSGRAATMAEVREIISTPSMAAHGPFEAAGIPTIAQEALSPHIPGLRNKAAQFVHWSKTLENVQAKAASQTEPFDDDEIATSMFGDGFDFREVKRRPITVYVVLPPDQMQRHSKWLRLLLTSAIRACLRPRMPGEPRVTIIMDEFFTLGRLEIVETVWALVRGYGISMVPVLQDLNQLQVLYNQLWQTFVGMAGVVLTYGTNDLTTADWLSRRAGETTRDIVTYSENSSTSNGSSSGGSNSSSSSGSSINYSRIKASLVSGHKLMGLPAGFLTATLDGGSNMVPLYAPAYYEIDQTSRRARFNPYRLGIGI